MQSRLMLSLTASAAVMLSLAAPGLVRAQGTAPAAIAGQVTSEAEGAMEGVVVTARKAGAKVAVSVIDRRARPLQLPGQSAGAGRIHAHDPRGRLRPRRQADRERCRREDRDRRPQARQDQEARLPAHQRRMDDEHSGDRGAEGVPAQLHGCHTLERIVRSTHDADEWTQVVHRMMGYAAVSQPIKPQRLMDPARAGNAGAVSQVRGISRHHQSEQVRHLGISAQDAAASQGPGHPRHHHRIRPAAADHRAA